MNGDDFTKSLLDKTDALIAKHRQPRGAIVPPPEGAADQDPALPVLTRKLSLEEAQALVKVSSEKTAKETADMQKALEQEMPVPPLAQASVMEAQPLKETRPDPWENTEAVSSQEETLLASDINWGTPPAADYAQPDNHFSESAADLVVHLTLPAQEETTPFTEPLSHDLSEPHFDEATTTSLENDNKTEPSIPSASLSGDTGLLGSHFSEPTLPVERDFSESDSSTSLLATSMSSLMADSAINAKNESQQTTTQQYESLIDDWQEFDLQIEASDREASRLAEAISPELTHLVCELTQEVSEAIIQQVMPKLQSAIEARLKDIISTAFKAAKAENED